MLEFVGVSVAKMSVVKSDFVQAEPAYDVIFLAKFHPGRKQESEELRLFISRQVAVLTNHGKLMIE